MATFPFDVWGEVRDTAAAGDVRRIKIVAAPGGGYLVLTVEEEGSEYDVWVETLQEVEADLSVLDVAWPPSGPIDASDARE